jgi:hypothetical protein
MATSEKNIGFGNVLPKDGRKMARGLSDGEPSLQLEQLPQGVLPSGRLLKLSGAVSRWNSEDFTVNCSAKWVARVIVAWRVAAPSSLGDFNGS